MVGSGTGDERHAGRFDSPEQSVQPGTGFGLREIAEIKAFHDAALAEMRGFVIGNEQLIEMILVALLCESHILIEGVPGTAKTTIAKLMARLTGCAFSRVQAAVDIQPADIIGVRIYHPERKEFEFRRGPLFTNILMIDEINRFSPKTQSAFIEAMSERQVTVDGTTYPLESPFSVIATQNPHEMEGTFPLIEVQRDRFMLGLRSGYMDPESELEIIRRMGEGKLELTAKYDALDPVLDRDSLLKASEMVKQVYLGDLVMHYIRDLVIATRRHADVELGASSRASLAFVKGGRAVAGLRGRKYVIPDDIKALAHEVLDHRLILSREAEIGGITSAQVIDEILGTVEVP